VSGSRGCWRRSPRRPDDGGAVAVFLAVTVALIVGIGTLAVDLGMQRVVRRDMQALADVAALDLARELDGRTISELAPELDRSDPSSAIRRVLAGNDTTLGSDPVVTVTWGAWQGGMFVADVDPPSAVRVGVSATTACHRLGSFAVVLEDEGSAVLSSLNDLLGLDLSLVAYDGLASAPVRLADIAADPRIGTPQQLLGASVSVSDLVAATAAVLARQDPDAFSVAITALDAVAGVAGGLGTTRLGDALSIAPTDSAALEADLSVLDVVSGALLAANGRSALSIPNLQAGVAGIGNHFDGSIDVINAASLACGRPHSLEARATNRQLAGDLDVEFVNLPSLNLNVGPIKGTVQTGKGTGTIHVALGNATSTLVDPPPVECGTGTQEDPTSFTVALDTGLAEYWVEALVEVEGSLKIGALKAEVQLEVRLRLATGGSAGAPVPVPLTVPENDTVPVRTGQQMGLLGSVVPTVSIESSSVSVLGGTVGVGDLGLLEDAVVAALTTGNNNFLDKTLRPLAANVDEELLGPATRLLGIRVGGADVFAVGATCNAPALRG
jgi:uncharacterized membrane protein